MHPHILNSLNYNVDLDNPIAHIITIKDHQLSEQYSQRAQLSCQRINQPYQVWDAFSVRDNQIIIPEHAIGQDHYKWLKQINDRLTTTEVACVLSHYSLWAKCVADNKAMVILEHDAIMVKPYTYHDAWNQIAYLGNLEQYKANKWASFPIMATAAPNYRFICRAHAYAIDPIVARQMIAHVLRVGIEAPADMIIRTDLFNIVQKDFHAFDLPGETSITDRDNNNHFYNYLRDKD